MGVKKLFTGRGKTRPIPRIVDESDRRAMAKLASQQPTTKATKDSFGPRVKAPAVFGKSTGAKTPAGGTFNPTDTGSLLGSD